MQREEKFLKRESPENMCYTSTMEESILEVKNLSVRFDETEVLSDISFSVPRGQATAIIGPNGAGKTVLFRALLGLVPARGSIVWRSGVKIGYVPQKLAVDRTTPITAQEFFLLKSKRFWRPEQKFQLHLKHELDLVGLSENLLPIPLPHLSGGQLQRVLIAWAMLNHPEALLFDEPTAGVDVGFGETIYEVMHRLQQDRGTTILLISHDLNVVYKYAQTVLCLNKTLVCSGTPIEILNSKQLSRLFGETAVYDHLKHHTIR